jgi:hypothetical protein
MKQPDTFTTFLFLPIIGVLLIYVSPCFANDSTARYGAG